MQDHSLLLGALGLSGTPNYPHPTIQSQIALSQAQIQMRAAAQAYANQQAMYCQPKVSPVVSKGWSQRYLDALIDVEIGRAQKEQK
jgi:hypothetical protein